MPTLTPPPPIPSSEFAERRKRALALAEESGFDALLVWSRGGGSNDWYGDVYYLANAVSPIQPLSDSPKWTDKGYTALILPVDGDPVLLTDTLDVPDGRVEVDDLRGVDHLPQGVADALKEKGLADRRVGLIGENSLRWSSHAKLIEAMGGGFTLHSAEHLLQPLRYIKSANEIAWIRHAFTVGVGWMNATLNAVQAGVTEGEAIGEGLKYLSQEGGIAYDVAISSGPRSKNFFSSWAIPHFDPYRELQDGDIVHADLWGPVQGYLTDFCRTTVVGRQPTDEQRELLEGVVDLIEHIVAGVKPGVTWGELYSRGSEWYAESGFDSVPDSPDEEWHSFAEIFPSFGHSCGLVVEPPYIIENEPTVLEPGAVVAIEHLLGRPGIGATGHEHVVVVTEDGCDILDAACPNQWWD